MTTLSLCLINGIILENTMGNDNPIESDTFYLNILTSAVKVVATKYVESNPPSICVKLR